MKPIALLLLILGIAGLVYGGIGYDRQTTIFDVGGIKATATDHKTVPIAPILGGALLLVGIVLLVNERRRA